MNKVSNAPPKELKLNLPVNLSNGVVSITKKFREVLGEEILRKAGAIWI